MAGVAIATPPQRGHSHRVDRKTVSLDITPEPFAFYDINMKNVAEPGELTLCLAITPAKPIGRRRF
jgi:hypothetical protein